MHKAVLRNKVNVPIKITEESHKNNTQYTDKEQENTSTSLRCRKCTQVQG